MFENNENFTSIFKNIKNLLKNAVKDRHHTYHTPVFNNISRENNAEGRTIVLRKFDESKLILNFHTDYRSPKIIDLKKNSNSSFIFYDFKIKTQLRIKTNSSIHHKNNTTKIAWELTGLSSRKCYLTKKPPSSITLESEDGLENHITGIDPTREESELGYENFVVIENKIKEIDWLYLDSNGHRRLHINCEKNNPIFNWLIP